jgi:hypothetical protein
MRRVEFAAKHARGVWSATESRNDNGLNVLRGAQNGTVAVNGNTIVQVDVNGNTTADFQIVLHGTNLNLQGTDFIL